MASYTLPTQTMTLGYDPGSRITSITSSANTTNPFSVGYDPLNRLTSFAGPGVAESFGYDAIGNRTQQTIGGVGSYTNAYSPTSNQIASTTGPTPKTYAFDANGSIVGDTINTFGYDARERMNQVTNTGGTTQYVVNALGQRVEKATGTAATMYHYDTGGHLIAESDPTGKVQAEYIYLNDIPVGVFK
jgi:YD repeat-containing protein